MPHRYARLDDEEIAEIRETFLAGDDDKMWALADDLGVSLDSLEKYTADLPRRVRWQEKRRQTMLFLNSAGVRTDEIATLLRVPVRTVLRDLAAAREAPFHFAPTREQAALADDLHRERQELAAERAKTKSRDQIEAEIVAASKGSSVKALAAQFGMNEARIERILVRAERLATKIPTTL